MKQKFQKIWDKAAPYLKKGVRKDFYVHTKMVVKAMVLILEREGGDENILIPAAILHDVGWAKVPIDIQKNYKNEVDEKKGLELHIEYAPEIVAEILEAENYLKDKIERITNIIIAHKFKNPKDKEKRLLIDADNLSDIIGEQLISDSQAYQKSVSEMLDLRKKHSKFYTKTARDIFEKECVEREKELKREI